jgi:hypothetical protein
MRHALQSQYPALKGSVLNNSELVKLPAIGKEGKSLKDCPEGVKELAGLGTLREADATTLVETTQMG